MPGCRLTGLRFFHVITNFIFDVYLRRASSFRRSSFSRSSFSTLPSNHSFSGLHDFILLHLDLYLCQKNRAKSTIAKTVFKVRGKAIHHVKAKKLNFPKTYNLFTFWGITKFCVTTCTASRLRKCSYLVSDFKAWNSIQWNTYDFDSEDNFSSGCRNVSQCHLKQFFLGLHSPGQSYFT